MCFIKLVTQKTEDKKASMSEETPRGYGAPSAAELFQLMWAAGTSNASRADYKVENTLPMSELAGNF